MFEPKLVSQAKIHDVLKGQVKIKAFKEIINKNNYNIYHNCYSYAILSAINNFIESGKGTIDIRTVLAAVVAVDGHDYFSIRFSDKFNIKVLDKGLYVYTTNRDDARRIWREDEVILPEAIYKNLPIQKSAIFVDAYI